MSNYYRITRKPVYHLINGLAYTEDNIKVHKLYVFKIPIQLNEDQLLQYFERFGRVESLKFLENDEMEHKVESDSDYEKFKIACVFFDNPRDAARVLLTKKHKVNGHRFYLKQRYSWCQPEAYGSLDELPVCLEQSYILQISDNCLNHIFKFLNLGDQLRFSRVCKRFRDFYQTMSRTLYKSFELSKLDGLTIWYTRDFFLLSGRDIENLSILGNELNWRNFSFIKANCVNLKSLIIEVCRLSARNISRMLENINKLENLTLVNCRVTDDCLVAINKLKNLKKLNLSGNDNFTGDTFMELPNSIEELNVSNCRNLKSSNLIRFLGTLPNLKDLSLRGVDTKNVYETLVLERKCLKLETLRLEVSEDSNYEEIAKLPNLKVIQIDSLHIQIKATFFDQLVLLKLQQLEQLEITLPAPMIHQILFFPAPIIDRMYPAAAMTDQMLMQIAKLSGLKRLLLRGAPVSDNILQLFTKLNNIEQISLISCHRITDKGVLQMLLDCPKLKELRLMNCRQITENLVTDIIKNMEGLRNDRNLPIHLHIEEEKISNATKANVREDIIKIIHQQNNGICLRALKAYAAVHRPNGLN